jgi:hypothetical protein
LQHKTGIGVERSSPKGPAAGVERTTIENESDVPALRTSVRSRSLFEARRIRTASSGEGRFGVVGLLGAAA